MGEQKTKQLIRNTGGPYSNIIAFYINTYLVKYQQIQTHTNITTMPLVALYPKKVEELLQNQDAGCKISLLNFPQEKVALLLNIAVEI